MQITESKELVRIFSPVWSDLQGSDFVREEIDSVEKAIEKVDAKHKVPFTEK